MGRVVEFKEEIVLVLALTPTSSKMTHWQVIHENAAHETRRSFTNRKLTILTWHTHNTKW